MKFSNFFDKKTSDFLKDEFHINDMLPIQENSIPSILKGKNSIVISSTGTGKTLCFVLPLLKKIKNINSSQAFIIVPTNELAKQIFDIIKKFSKIFNDITIFNSFKKHKSNLNITSKIIISSPSELVKLIREGKVNLNNLSTIILDEADMLLEFFKGEVNFLFNRFRKKNDIQYCLFSATLHDSLANLIKKQIPNSTIIRDKKDIWNNENIQHYLVDLGNIINFENDKKLEALNLLLKDINPFFALVFVNDKKTADILYKYLLLNEYKVGILHSELNSNSRKDVFIKANKLQYQILVCTDLAARGIDLNGVSDIISFDLPRDDLYYIHRAGRTGRGKYKGNSYIFKTDKDVDKIRKLKDKINFKNIKL